jgi:hypothetical protein
MKEVKEAVQKIRILVTEIQYGKDINTKAIVSEINNLTYYIDGMLDGIKSNTNINTKGNTRETSASDILHYLFTAYKMSVTDIRVLGKSLGIGKFTLDALTEAECTAIYNEAKALYKEGLLRRYLDLLLAQEEKHDAPPKPVTSGMRELSY